MPEIQIEPSGVTSLSSEYLPGYIAMSDLSFYTSGTTTFFYTNPTSNSFLGVGTLSPSLSSLTYNCLSYAVGVNDCWLWPWAQNPTQTELDLFMARTAMYGSRPGNAYEVSAIFGADVIYYSDCDWGTGGDGHFARVMAWDSIGIPTVIQSKWGQCELIQSTGYSPFSSGTFYGNPKRYYKQK